MESTESDPVTVRAIEDESQCDRIDTVDYYFHRIGAAVPVVSPSTPFDLANPPVQPLAVSEWRGIVFVAHGEGFCVARTRDLVELAKEMKDKGGGGMGCVVERCVVDVRVGRVWVLEVSRGEEIVAVAVQGDVHFFEVEALLNKVEKPFYSCSVDSDFVKNICWSRKMRNAFIVLSGSGKLYKGVVGGHLQARMDDVDAVDWGVRGDVIAVAKKNIVSIVSSNLEERLRISLPFKSWIADSDTTCSIRVDSIRWLRTDCIVIGCLQQATDGNEENYFVQAILSQGGNFTNAGSVPVVLELSDLFPGIVDDIMPSGCGPHLLACYLKDWALALMANKKNVCEHISMVGWSDGNSGPAIIDIERDDCLPRIELQENDDDNLVLGMCVDKASVYEKVEVNLVEGQKELSPYCIVLCLTLEGKLIMYHVSSVDESSHPPAVVSLSDDEEEKPTGPLQTAKQLAIDQESLEVNKVGEVENGQLPKQQDLVLSGLNSSLPRATIGSLVNRSGTTAGKGEEKLHLGKESSDSVQKQLSSSKGTLESGGSVFLDNGESKILQLKTTQAQTPIPSTDNLSVAEKWKPFDTISKTIQFGENHLPNTSSRLSTKDGTSSLDVGRKTPEQPGSTSLWGSSAKSASSIFPALSGGYGSRPPFQSPSFFSSTSVSVGASADAAAATKGLPSNSASHPSSGLNFFSETTLNSRQKDSVNAGMRGASPLSLMSQGTLTKPHREVPAAMADQRKTSLAGRLDELKLSKHNGNVKDMADDLDKLLRGLGEEVEDFKETCIIGRDNSLDSLEEGIKAVFDESKMWKGCVDQQLEEILHLLDKTVQAREKYMEGIIKQTTDGQYWDLWQSQRLSSELEARRKNILNMSENLINRLSDLEKHFNAFELNRFGGKEVDAVGRRPLSSRSSASGNIQSLRAVQNAMSSQLAAAEQLSECLSRQMTALNMKSPETKKEDFRKQLFETIGIPYNDVHLNSPDKAEKIVEPPSRNSFLSPLSSIRDKSSRNQITGSSQEPETSRRRRDSLGQSLVKFDAPKTTIKRMPLCDGSFMSTEKQLSTSFKLEAASPEDQTVHSTLLHDQKNMPITHREAATGTSSSSMFTWNKDASGPSRGDLMGTNSLQTKYKNNLALLAQDAAKTIAPKDSNLQQGSNESRAAIPSPGLTHTKLFESAPTKETAGNRSDDLAKQVQPVSGLVLPQTSVQPAGGNLYQRATGQLPLSFSSVNSKPFGIPTVSDHPATFFKPSVPAVSAGSEGVPSYTWAKPISPRPSSPVTSPPSASISSSSSVITQTPSVSSVIDGSLSGKGSSSADQSLLKAATSMGTPTSFIPSSTPSVEPLQPASALVSKSESQKADIQPSADNVGRDTAKEKVEFKLDLTTKSSNAIPELSSASKPSPAHAASDVSNVASISQPQKPSFTFVLPKEQSPSPVGGSLVTSAVDSTADDEDDMEEEASEAGQTIDLNLGSLGGFSMASNPSLFDSRLNPFGVSFPTSANTTPANMPSAFAMSPPSKDLFRPASFSFQSLQPSLQTAPPAAFSSGHAPQTPAVGGFGQPSQIGAGQQALGSVLGSFGQSRQIGAPVPGTGFGGGFAAPQSAAGFENAAAIGGFAAAATSGGSPAANAATGGFAAMSWGGGGFASAAGSGGFAGAAASGGFAGAAAGGGFAGSAGVGGFAGAAGGGGFGAFINQGAAGLGGSKPIASNLFTQMRK
ncbi:Nuclear pore complex protein NUP214-like protein [Drosera capensis]